MPWWDVKTLQLVADCHRISMKQRFAKSSSLSATWMPWWDTTVGSWYQRVVQQSMQIIWKTNKSTRGALCYAVGSPIHPATTVPMLGRNAHWNRILHLQQQRLVIPGWVENLPKGCKEAHPCWEIFNGSLPVVLDTFRTRSGITLIHTSGLLITSRFLYFLATPYIQVTFYIRVTFSSGLLKCHFRVIYTSGCPTNLWFVHNRCWCSNDKSA